MNEIKDLVENEQIEEIEAQVDITAKPSNNVKRKKHEMARELVDEAKKMVKDADEQSVACKLLLEDDLKEYDEAKASLKSGGMDVCTELVEQLNANTHEKDGAYTLKEEEEAEAVAVFEPKEEVKPMQTQEVSSGRFTGFIYALLGGGLTAGGLAYVASQKLGMVVSTDKLPKKEEIEQVLSWLSTTVGQEPNISIGAALVGASALVVMGAIYAIRVATKANKNLQFATKQLEDAKAYTLQKQSCKEEMDRVDVHMKETIKTLKMYEVLLNEQKGKLERILFIEGNAQNEETKYHEKSLVEIKESNEMLNAAKNFMDTPMSHEGKLSEKSVHLLVHLKLQMEKVLERRY